MNSTYYESAKVRVAAALKGNPSTFEELCKKCQGLYPSQVRDIIKDMNIYNTLVPLYTTEQSVLPYECINKSFYDEREIVTASLQNNPILSSWYFSWDTCYKIAQLDVWKGKKILFLGTPRLFEYFIIRRFGDELVLVDLDTTVINALSKKYASLTQNAKILCYQADINNFNITEFRKNCSVSYDYIFFDPPWYPTNYLNWLSTALQLLSETGKIVFSLFPVLLRPTAIKERKEILDQCRRVAANAFICSGMLEYDIPSFERKELEVEGLMLRSNWKTSDMVILSGITCLNYVDYNIKSEPYAVWHEFMWLGCRWFLDTSRSFFTASQLVSAPQQKLFLKNPSRRNVQLLEVNLLSSKGHGLRISDPKFFLSLVQSLQHLDNPSSQDAIDSLPIDQFSKDIITKIKDDNL